ncbi:HNH endonuclease [archaeon]|nr:HNH endonuclease [archaeon]NCP79138.1 HNH endonuclease [archaeon]NCP97916.1 HNH endonuclease [archaeon]NCQ06905.1 HNH endonuclease [archaeon]NCQ50701.1 HNH endonuclease [archaeon]
MTEQIGSGLSCYLCGEDHPAVIKKLELHHIDGKANSNTTVAICQNCHNKITCEQNKLSPKLRSNKNKDSLIKLGYQLLSHGALLKTLGETQIKIGKEMIEYEKNNT